LFGSHLASFALGVWVYQQTRSATDFSLISFFTVLPEIALSPIAGVIVDRWNKRSVMLLGTIASGLCGAAMAFLAITGQLQLWHIYLIVTVNSAFQSLEFPVLSASIVLLVPRHHLSRANGLLELSSSLSMVVAPVAAGMLLELVGLTRLLVFNVVASLVALASLAVIRIGVASQAESQSPRISFMREATLGWRYIRERPELMALLLLFTTTNFSLGVVEVLLAPLVLSFASSEVLGMVMSAGGVGILLGSLLVSVWGGPRQKIPAILGLAFVKGTILFLGGLEPQAVLIGTAAFIFLFCGPIIFTSSQTLWQTKVAQEVQGRTFAIRRVVAWSSLPLAYLVAGPLADRVFEPLMAVDGFLAGSVGAVIGTGPGRGVALLFMVLGCLSVMAVVVGTFYRPLRELETRLPDVS